MARERRDDGSTIVGRYRLGDEIAAGGMATVHLGRLEGAAGFSRTVAIKRLHRPYATDPEFVAMLVDEARLASRIHHPNVVATLDVVNHGSELLVVMEYVHGESLSSLLRRAREIGEPPAAAVAVAIVIDTLYGLAAAHDAKDDSGRALEIVHRDVSPHNVIVGADGVARVADFGVAKATVRWQTTRTGQIKGKLRYMAPEQLRGEPVGVAADVYAAGAVLWELLAGEPLFHATDEAVVFGLVLEGRIVPPSELSSGVSRDLDEIVMRALTRDPATRFASTRQMASALEAACTRASPVEVGAWVEQIGGEDLSRRREAFDRGVEAEPAKETSTRTALAMPEPPPTTPTRARRGAHGLLLVACAVALVLTIVVVLRARAARGAPAARGLLEAFESVSDALQKRTDERIIEAAREGAHAVEPSAHPGNTAPSAIPAEGTTRSSASHVSGPGCNPPYFVDSTGFRHIKRECL